MKLEVGMYVRTKIGVIGEVISIDKDSHDNNIITIFNGNFHIIHNEIKTEFDITKASHNIIDLIEVGDIIKFDITDTDNYAEIQGYNCWEISCEEELNGVKEMIEMESAKLLSIVTKEQFESMAYKVGD